MLPILFSIGIIRNEGKWSEILTERFPEYFSGRMELVKILSIRVPPFELILVGIVIEGANELAIIVS